MHSLICGQGLPLWQVYLKRSTKLEAQAAVGWGANAGPFTFPSKAPKGFNAGTLATACNAGDPRLAGGYQPLGVVRHFGLDREREIYEDFGVATYGGKGKQTGEAATFYKGLTQEESNKIKKEAIEQALEAGAEAYDARREANADPKNADKERIAAEKERKFEQKKAVAKRDPNLETLFAGDADGSTGVARGTDASTCAAVMEVARDLLAECHRTGGKAFACQQLFASVNNCPDPSLIFVDPDAGYACAPTVDPQLVIDAWQRECEKRATPGPDGGSPCSKPKPSDSGRTMEADEGDMCQNVFARTVPESDGCIAPMVLDPFGRPDIPGLIVWGQGVLGGPVIVLPLPRSPIVLKGGLPV